MASFYVYDIIFLVLFCIGIYWFLKTRRSQLSREGWMFMYRTQLGVKAMSWFDDRFHNVLGALRYVIVALGFLLMGVMIFMLGQSAWIYVSRPDIAGAIKAPPIAPLIPYFPELFGLTSIFPPFYFTYFLVSLAIVAVVHEFSHGIFMRYSKTKIKSTGLVFLGPILGAFVEEDATSFHGKDRFNQMAVLGAGVFANVVFAILFYLMYMAFFYSSFTAAGFVFDSYGIGVVNSSDIDSVSVEGNYTVLNVNGAKFFLDSSMLVQLEENRSRLIAYEDSAAFNSGLYGVVVGIDAYRIIDRDTLSAALDNYAPGDSAVIYTVANGEDLQFEVTFTEHPYEAGEPYLGVGFYGGGNGGVISRLLSWFVSFKQPSTYYEPTWDGEFVFFIFYLLWWVMVINLLVALFNMLPLGILDGGRFFYLAVGYFVGDKIAERLFGWATKFIFFLFAVMMWFWFIRLF
ncbi:MAG: membrane-associated protease RseP (regulator of RpoE activity) [Patescibacteria group bacterium]|jgi:membrane-associated protease RseP (regulator of RpoE activity)